MQSGLLHNVCRDKSNGQRTGEQGEIADLLSGRLLNILVNPLKNVIYIILCLGFDLRRYWRGVWLHDYPFALRYWRLARFATGCFGSHFLRNHRGYLDSIGPSNSYVYSLLLPICQVKTRAPTDLISLCVKNAAPTTLLLYFSFNYCRFKRLFETKL